MPVLDRKDGPLSVRHVPGGERRFLPHSSSLDSYSVEMGESSPKQVTFQLPQILIDCETGFAFSMLYLYPYFYSNNNSPHEKDEPCTPFHDISECEEATSRACGMLMNTVGRVKGTRESGKPPRGAVY